MKLKSYLEELGLSPEIALDIYAEMDDTSALDHQQQLEQQQQEAAQ